jgi:hypothetical protein
MWGLFKSKPPPCPVEDDYRQWLEGRWGWLSEQLGADTPRQVQVVLPTPEFFPDPFHGKPEDVPPMFARVARYMGVESQPFTLFFYDEGREVSHFGLGHSRTSGSAGLYVKGQGEGETTKIGIELSQLVDPMRLVATLAHEVAHEILLGQGRISRDEHDHEPLTDLVTVFRGMGLFTANATITDRGFTSGAWASWRTQRLGYLDQRCFGYALALFAQARGESNPPWLRHVRPDVRAPLKQGLRFLESLET